jgi:hypothetical protein
VLKWFLPVVVYVGLIKIFVPDEPHNFPTLNIVAGLPLLIGLVCLFVVTPPFLLYTSLREAPLIEAHPWSGGLLLVGSCVVPLTAVFAAILPKAAHSVRESRPVFSALWLLGTFAASAFLASVAVSKLAPGRSEVPAPVPNDAAASSSRAELKRQVAAEPARRMKFKEIVQMLACISTIVMTIYTLVRGVTR